MKSIELGYLKDKEGHLELDLCNRRYLIDFNSMTRTNLKSKQERNIRRRPYDSKELQRIKDMKVMKERELQRKAELEEAKRLQKIEDDKQKNKAEMHRKAELEEAKRLQVIENRKLILERNKYLLEEAKRQVVSKSDPPNKTTQQSSTIGTIIQPNTSPISTMQKSSTPTIAREQPITSMPTTRFIAYFMYGLLTCILIYVIMHIY